MRIILSLLVILVISCNVNVKKSGPDDENQVKISADGAIKHYGGFKPCIFFDVTTQLELAKTNLAEEMAKSTLLSNLL